MDHGCRNPAHRFAVATVQHERNPNALVFMLLLALGWISLFPNRKNRNRGSIVETLRKSGIDPDLRRGPAPHENAERDVTPPRRRREEETAAGAFLQA